MKKIININLSGRVIPIEDAAYDNLQRYIESLRRYFSREEGRDEIINDIESRIAELMNEKIKKGAACVTESDIAEIIAGMGRVEDFEAAEGETASAGTMASASAASSSYEAKSAPPKGRLYRNSNDKFLGGVCSGVAAYMNVDPTVVRLLFAIITFGGFGLGFLIYLLLWIILPTGNIEGYTGKRFFRNPDDQILGGVCGGLAAYFNKNVKTVRIIFAIPLIINIIASVMDGIFSFNGMDVDFVDVAFGSLTSTFVLAYIILWIVLPLARTPYEKMEMRGEKVDVNRIKQNVQEGMGDFKVRAQAFGDEVKASAQNLNERIGNFNRTTGRRFAGDLSATAATAGSGIGHAIGVLFKAFFLFVAGVIAFALFVVVLTFLFGGVYKPLNNFLLEGFWQRTSLWGILIFFLAVPLVAIITWVIRRVLKVRSQNRYLGWTFGGLWTLGWICLPIFISSLVRDFRFTERIETPIVLAQARPAKLVVQVPEAAIRYSGHFGWIDSDGDDGWDITEDSLRISNVRVVVKQSEDSLYHVTLYKSSGGANRASAQDRAEKIEFTVRSQDSLLMLGSGFGISKDAKFRGQKVLVEIKVPTNGQIRFDHSVGEKLNPYNIRVGENERQNRRRNWGRRSFEVEWDNNDFYDWQPDTDYYMMATGKLREVGSMEETTPAVTPDNNNVRDSIRQEAERKIDSIDRIRQREDETMGDSEETSETHNIGGDLPTPMPVPFVPTIF